MQVVADFVGVPPAIVRHRPGALDVIQLAENRILDGLRAERAVTGDHNRREVLEPLFRRQIDAAVGIPESELTDRRRREHACQYRAAGVRAIDDVAAVAAEDPGNLVILIAEVVAAHQPRGVAPVVVHTRERVWRVVGERHVRLIAPGVDRGPVRLRVQREPLGDDLIPARGTGVDRAFGRQRHSPDRRVGAAADVVFEHRKVEEPVAHGGTAGGRAIQVGAEIRETTAGGRRTESGNLIRGAPARLHVGRFRLESLVVVEVLERRAVEPVRPRFAQGPHLRAAGAPEFRLIVRRQDFELAHAFDTDRRPVVVVLGIDVRDAIELVVRRTGRGAVGDDVAAARSEKGSPEAPTRCGHARSLGRDTVDVPAHGVRGPDRDFFQCRFVVRPFELGARDLDRRRRRLHRDCLRHRRDGQREVDHRAVVDANGHALLRLGPEPAQIGTDVVGSRRHIGHAIQPFARRRHRECRRRGGVQRRDRDARQHRARTVGDAAFNRSADDLGFSPGHEGQQRYG